MRTPLLALLSLVVVRGQAPDWPHGGGACASDWDCSLGGTCESSRCVCDAWWTGSSCALLNLQPAESLTSQGLQVPDYYSWGGHPLQAEVNGTFHLFASFLCDHASLGSWTSKSSVAHATASRPEGPYTFAAGLDQQLVVPPWSHGAYIIQDPPTQQYLLWHLGDGTISNSSWGPCYNSSQSGDGSSVSFSPADAEPLSLGIPGQKQAFVQTSSSLLGPWTPFNNDTGISVTFPPGSWTSGIDNPAPFIFENGTTLLFFRSETCPKNWGALAPACIGVARADTWQGPYTSLFENPITHPEGEDPSVFMDPRGNMHMLTNVNTYHARCARGIPCGGHAWSRDGLTWSNQTIGAFGPVIRFTNGTYFTGAYAERPQVFQAKDGTPIAFYMGFGRSSYMDSANFAQLFCTAALDPSRDCGPQQPPAPTKVNPKQGDLCLIANATVFPCPGGWNKSCPVLLGSCDDSTASWLLQSLGGGQKTLSNSDAQNPAYAGSVLNIDCNSCAAGTLVKVSNEEKYASSIALSAGGQLQAPLCPGMCLSGTSQLARKVPCKAGEFYENNQVILVPCSSADADGWSF
jgi:hypothetical protein